MAYNQVGIVIGETIIKEDSKMLTLLLKDRGKISVLAKNVLKPNSKLMAGCQLFSYGDFTILEKNTLRMITSVETIKSFYTIREDYDSFCVASIITELVNKYIMEEEEVNEILFLLFLGLDNLSINKNSKKILFVFILKFLQICGDAPPIDFCSNCGDNIQKNGYFSNSGMVCNACSKLEYVNLLEVEIFALKFILKENVNKCFSFSIPEKSVEKLSRVFVQYIYNNMEFKINSLNLL